jgi:acyl carrier protein
LIEQVGRLSGVVHTAGVLADSVFGQLDLAQLETVLRPKVDAAWWLHELTLEHELSMFVVFSSIAGVLGGPGQANYAAANGFLDGLAAYRRELGLAGLSLAWGWWQRASGMTGHLGQVDQERLTRGGMRGLSDADGLTLFDAALVAGRSQVVPAKFDLTAIGRSGAVPAVLQGLVRRTRRQAAGGDGGDGGSWAGRMAAMTPEDRERSVLESVYRLAAVVLGHPDARGIHPGQAFKDLGFDSLTAVEFRNRLSAMTGLRLPVTLIFDYPAADAVARYLLSQVEPAEPFADVDERELRKVLAAVSVTSLREAGVLDVLLRLGAADSPDVREPDDETLIDAMDDGALIRHVLDGAGK